jgi:hypothetical protein
VRFEEISVSAATAPTWRIRVDNNLNRAIIEVRSSEGQVIRQYPTEAQLKAFARAEALKAARQHEVNAELNAKLAGGSPDTAAKAAPEIKFSTPAPSSAPAADTGSADASGGATSTQSIEV